MQQTRNPHPSMLHPVFLPESLPAQEHVGIDGEFVSRSPWVCPRLAAVMLNLIYSPGPRLLFWLYGNKHRAVTT